MNMKSRPSAETSDSDQPRYVFKVILCGDYAVGKTSLVRRYVENRFSHDYKPSIGVNVLEKIISVGKEKLKLDIWDTGGQERLKSLRKKYFFGSDAAIFVFDITRASSAVSIQDQWVKEVESVLGKDFLRILVGNKSDLDNDREISEYAGKQLAERFTANYVETSALDGRNVDVAFTELASRLMKKRFPEA